MARKKPSAVVILEQKGVEIVDFDPLGIEVTCDSTNNTPEDVAAGRVNVNVKVTEPRESVRHVPIEESRALLTVPIDSPIWGGSPPHSRAMKKIEGAIVRLRPPEGATDDTLEEVRGFFLKYGAAKVVVLPRPRAELLPAKAAKVKAEGAREAVTALVEESNSKDKAALEKLCETVMGKVGL